MRFDVLARLFSGRRFDFSNFVMLMRVDPMTLVFSARTLSRTEVYCANGSKVLGNDRIRARCKRFIML
jgi:hypothetical protein